MPAPTGGCGDDEINHILEYCKKHGIKHLFRAICLVKTDGYTFTEAAEQIGVSKERLCKDFKWLGRKIRGGRGCATPQVADLPLFAGGGA